jgi:hypothetical protein
MTALATICALAAVQAEGQTRRRGPTATYFAPTGTITVPVIANGERLPQDALLLEGAARTMLPMRALFTSLGAQVVWNAPQRAVYAWKTDGTGVRFGVGERVAQTLIMPGPDQQATVVERRTLDAPATLIGSRLYIPIRAAGELLGTEVRWDAEERVVHIGTNPPVVTGAAR